MGLQQSDIFIKTAIELGIEDMRKNPYLIEHMLDDLVTNRYVKEKYGLKQVEACKEWIANNQIEVNLRPRDDRDRLPCVSIYLENSNEKPDMKSMADQSPESLILLPNKIGKPIPFIVNPFVPEGYDQALGVVEVPDSVNLDIITPGMVLVNPQNGNGYVILGIVEGGLQVGPGQEIDASELAIIPQYKFYKARIDRIFNEEVYSIACNAHGDPQNVIFLWNIVKYSILRYKQALLEGNGMYETVLSSSGGPDLVEWTAPGGERIYVRMFKITCMTEDTWIQAPHRIFESVSFSPKQKKCKGVTGGIKIISNLNTSPFIDPTTQSWTTVEDNGVGPDDDGDDD